MVDVAKSAIVPYSPEQMMNLVNDVARYPEFLNGCIHGVMHHKEGDHYEASLTMRIKGIKVTFTTRNEIITLEDESQLKLSLKEGPFRDLNGQWAFKSLGDAGCRVSLHLSYHVRSSMINQLFAKGFEHMARQMVGDFVNRAGVIYDAN